MKGPGIIDAHMHFCDIQAFQSAAEDARADYSYMGLRREAEACGVRAFVSMGAAETKPGAFPDRKAPNPMTAGMLEEMEFPPPNIYQCLGINPHALDEAAVRRLGQKILADPSVVGFKLYPGYYHVGMADRVYEPVFELAAEYGLTVAIHTGVTYSEDALMEYAHPLAADRLAVAYRDTKFLLCHMGNPWVMDACEVAYKNRNVYLDISGLAEGSPASVGAVAEKPLLTARYETGLQYLNNYKKVLFGTDWPIVPYMEYVGLCMDLVPAQHRGDVFWNNAVKLYGLKMD